MALQVLRPAIQVQVCNDQAQERDTSPLAINRFILMAIHSMCMENKTYEILIELSKCEVRKKKYPKDTANLYRLAKARKAYEQIKLERGEVVCEYWKTCFAGLRA